VISIIIPVYNNLAYLIKRFDSILNQNYRDFEIIILDDNSKDGSWDLICQFQNSTVGTKILKSESNSGSPFGQWINGFKLASGDFIWIAEADDFCEPDFLEILVKAFEDPEVVVSHCRSFDFRSENDFKRNEWWDSFGEDIWDSDFVADGKELIKMFGRFKCPVINVSSAIFRKSALVGIEIPYSYKYCGDWWFWAQIFQKGKISFIAKPLNFIRKHNESATSFYNVNLAQFAKEATLIAKKINNEVLTEFKFDIHYYWLVDFWYRGFLLNKKFNVLLDFIFILPKSFQILVVKEIFNHYKGKFIF